MPVQPKKPMKKHVKNKKNRIVYGPVATVFASVNTGSWRILRPEVDHCQCVGCGQCKTFCPTGVIEIRETNPDHRAGKSFEVEIDWRCCKGCGICANVCPGKCIKMVKEENEEKN